jgi:hypothetical protein
MSPTDPAALPPLTPEEEAIMNEEIDATLRPFLTITPAPLLVIMREQAERAMRTDPGARKLLAAAVRRPAPDASAEVARDGAPSDSGAKNGGGDKGAS